ncbi:DnaA regulatory inactivator HdaA [Parasphingorhabdus litoris]|uniref:DnaA regulatory inactivator HdaA n=1 Tax=Parasphingorhabdus litoris TaxID=394733 RepID=A0ABN1AAQ8_9SPHN|nr:DnaA/Hda family protein [Parasphingorhabdus litoris]
MTQIALPLEIEPNPKGDGYLVTDCNRQVHEQLENWSSWPNATAILVGGPGSGKKAMAQKFASYSGGRFVANAHDAADDALFHLWNQSQADKLPLLLTSSRDVSSWQVELPDLKSRLAASLLIEIGVPDEAMIEGLLQKYFSLRGLSISEDALAYLSKRMERSYQDVQLLAQLMDSLAIEKKKPITRSIAIEALSQHQQLAEKNRNAPEADQNVEEG